MRDDVPIQSVSTGLKILEMLVNRGEMTLSELRRVMDMPKSTVHDYLTTLTASGYVIKNDGRYRASTRCLELGVSVRGSMQLFRLAKPEIDSLAEETAEHASLMIEEQGVGVLLYIARGERALNLGVSEGYRMRLPTNAPGKAILARMPRSKVERILDRHGLPQLTEATITDREELYERLETVQDQGYALDLGERVEGVRAVSVPITTRNEVHGAITLSGTTNRMQEEQLTGTLPDLLAQSTDDIEVQYTLKN